ncbi:tetratricopeptide repeat protein [Acinetobacter sp.]|uniref:tetratricopeptide repeat protein n=1 Tax=Acinetobacter sp. TaxID=472 RepID=UPI003D01A7CD
MAKFRLMVLIVLVALVYFPLDGYSGDHEILRMISEGGDPIAQNTLGSLYFKGLDGVPVDYAEAAKWFSLSAEQGYDDSQFMLGIMYDQGRGIPVNHEKAVEWLNKAAAKGHYGAQGYLGRVYLNGTGTIQPNPFRAIYLLEKAAGQGKPDDQFLVAVVYCFGRHGVPENYVKAYSWSSIAAAQGHRHARDIINYLKTVMTPNQIAESQKEADVIWKRLQEKLN